MSGQTGGISSLFEFEWFLWVMLFQPKETYPDNTVFIGRWIGPVIDVGTAMTYKILRPDGGYVCRSTVKSWASKEESNPVRMAERMSFMKHLNSCIGHAAKLSDFPLNDLTPEFEYYADGIEVGFEGTPDEIKEAPPPMKLCLKFLNRMEFPPRLLLTSQRNRTLANLQRNAARLTAILSPLSLIPLGCMQ